MPDTVVSNLPRWLVRHVCRAENHKLVGKRPATWVGAYAHNRPSRSWNNATQRFEDDLPILRGRGEFTSIPGGRCIDNRLPHIYRGDSNYDVTKFSETRRMGTDLIAHLDNNDYRLWSEVREPHQESGSRLIMARCRWCQARFPLKQFETTVRKHHKVLCNYTHNLRAVFDIVLAKGQCIVCNRHTREQAWGLPLCSESCKTEWKFAERTNGYMAAAMHKARFECRLKESASASPASPTL